MAYLIDTLEDLRRHVLVSASFDFKKVELFRKRAERNYIINLIGREEYDNIIIHILNEESGLPIDEVKILFEEAAANFTLFMAFPFIKTQITNYGNRTTENKESSKANWQDDQDLKSSLFQIANEALDKALEIMEKNQDVFPDWSASEKFTIFKSKIVRHTNEFDAIFSIQNSRKTYLSLIPFMDEVEERFLISMLGDCTLNQLKQTSADEIIIRAQDLLKKAVVNLTIARVALVGMFSITPSSLVISTEELPWQRKKLELDDDQLDRLKKDRDTAGNEYLKKLKTILLANPTIFDCYEDKSEEGLGNKIKKLKSGLSIL